MKKTPLKKKAPTKKVAKKPLTRKEDLGVKLRNFEVESKLFEDFQKVCKDVLDSNFSRRLRYHMKQDVNENAEKAGIKLKKGGY
jgi:hypothetical protein